MDAHFQLSKNHLPTVMQKKSIRTQRNDLNESSQAEVTISYDECPIRSGLKVYIQKKQIQNLNLVQEQAKAF